MTYHFYFLLLPTKLIIKNKINKKMDEKVAVLELQCYYKEQLTKKEKSEFLRYLMNQFGYSYCSIQNKMTGLASFNKRDLILIGQVVKDESWRA